MKREVALARPGEILLKDWLEPLGITQYALAKAIDVPRRRINEIVLGRRAITADTATRLGAFFGVDFTVSVGINEFVQVKQNPAHLGQACVFARVLG